MEDRINAKIKYLELMLEKYEKLGWDYNYRVNAIYCQIDALEELKNNKPDNNWNTCYEEDLRESKRIK